MAKKKGPAKAAAAAEAKKDEQDASSGQTPVQPQGNLAASSSQTPGHSGAAQQQAPAQPPVNVTSGPLSLPILSIAVQQQAPAQPHANTIAGFSNLPAHSVAAQQKALVQPQASVPAISSNLPARSVDDYECEEPKYLQATGKIMRHDPGEPSHRDIPINTVQATQADEFKFENTKLEFDSYNPSNFCKDQDRASILFQREAARKIDTSASHEHHTLRPALVSDPGNGVKIITNHFKVAIPAGQVLYEYHVEGIPEKASRSKRKMIILDMIEISPVLHAARDQIATDYKHKIISSAPLFSPNEPPPGAHVTQINVNYFEPGNRDKAPGQIELGIFFSAKYELDGLKGFVEGRDELYRDRGAKEALNVVIAKAVADPVNSGNTFQAGDNQFFYRPAWEDLNRESGLVSTRGFFSSIRPAMNSILLNVNVVNSAFYKAQGLHRYLEPLVSKHKTLERVPRDDLEALKRHLRGLRVALNFDRTNVDGQGPELNNVARRTKTICDLGDVPEIQTFRQGNDAAVNVWKHLHNKYANAKLIKDNVISAAVGAVNDADKDMPTVNVGQLKKNQKFYLPRQLDVLSDQLYRGQLSSDDTASMIKIAKQLPEFNYHAILSEGLKSLRLLPDQSKSPIMTNLGMRIEPQLLELTARVIESPNVLYKNDKGADKAIKTNSGFWDVSKNKVEFTAAGSGFANVVDAKKASGASKEDDAPSKATVQVICVKNTNYESRKIVLLTYIKQFLQVYERHGGPSLAIEPSLLEIDDWSATSLEHLLREEMPKDAVLALAIFPANNKEYRQAYTSFRIVVDQRLGFRSICLCESKMYSIIKSERTLPLPLGPRTDLSLSDRLEDYFRNASMKLNARGGGTNHVLAGGSLLVIEKKNKPCDTIILGADVTHPAPGSIKGTPSIAAVVGSLDGKFARFSGQMRLNKAGKDIIYGMKDMARALFNDWSKENGGKIPRRILLYRDGVGDSQYSEVRSIEIAAIRSAWQEYKDNLTEKKPDFDFGVSDLSTPEITAVVVTKRHNTRLYPKPATKVITQGKETRSVLDPTEMKMTKSHNCHPGTVVDSGITSPYYFDFFLLSHNVPGSTGTAKPTHYFVLENGMNFSPKDLQDLTYNLCFTYCKSTSAVSYVPATYYADRLCERGRLYLQPFLDRVKDLRDKNLNEEGVMKEAMKDFYRGGARGSGSDGRAMNPWHRKHDGCMFWM